MMLAPETRVLLTDTLRPPDGFRVEVAVGTTYSLDLTALLLAPLSFALFDQVNDGNVDTVDPIKVLEAANRHGAHTTVFCQAGAIHVPAEYRRLLVFVEDSVREVVPPRANRIFHPKIWVLRFVDQHGGRRHRLVCLSRNITFDRSWDTALCLDEADEGTIDAGPAAEFVRSLPSLTTRQLSDARTDQVQDLAGTLSRVRLAVPAPFTDGNLMPLGLGEQPWPFPPAAQRVIVISPFADRATLRDLAGITDERVIVSRPETFDQLGTDALAGWNARTLQRMVELGLGEEVRTATAAVDEFQRANEGLHAKTCVIDLAGPQQGRSLVVTGSANLTGAGWHGNVEFDVALTGPTSTCGVAATLDGTGDVPGMSRMLEIYEPSSTDGLSDAAQRTSWLLEMFHQALAATAPTLQVRRDGDDRVLTLGVRAPHDDPGETVVWPVSLPAKAQRQPLADGLQWTVAPLNVTPFLAVETSSSVGDAHVVRRCVIQARLTGDIDHRRSDTVFSILTSKQDVLRYLVFLLGDPSYDALFEQLSGAAGKGQFGAADSGSGIALFEPLVRAVGRDEDALARVANLVDDLADAANGSELVPDGFAELWDVVWRAHMEGRQ